MPWMLTQGSPVVPVPEAESTPALQDTEKLSPAPSLATELFVTVTTAPAGPAAPRMRAAAAARGMEFRIRFIPGC